MIQISQPEAFYLRAKGRGNDIHMSSQNHKSHSKRYYATESDKTMRLLKKFRESTVLETFENRR